MKTISTFFPCTIASTDFSSCFIGDGEFFGGFSGFVGKVATEYVFLEVGPTVDAIGGFREG